MFCCGSGTMCLYIVTVGRAPPTKITRQKRAKSSITQPWIIPLFYAISEVFRDI